MLGPEVAVQKIHQNRKKGSFCEELLSENDYEAVLANFCCYEFGVSASQAVQKISTRTLEWYANSLKYLILLDFIATYEKTCLLQIQARFLFFFQTKIKMSKQHKIYLLHIGLVLINSKKFTLSTLPVWE